MSSTIIKLLGLTEADPPTRNIDGKEFKHVPIGQITRFDDAVKLALETEEGGWSIGAIRRRLKDHGFKDFEIGYALSKIGV